MPRFPSALVLSFYMRSCYTGGRKPSPPGNKEGLQMNVGSVLVLIALVAIDRFLHKRFPRFYQRIQLPALIFASLLAAVYCAFLGYGAWQVLTSGVSAGDKGFFVIFVAVVIAIYAAVLIFAWTDWLRKRRRTS